MGNLILQCDRFGSHNWRGNFDEIERKVSNCFNMSNPRYKRLTSPTDSMNEERLNPRFPVRAMTVYLEQGLQNVLLKEKIMLQFERDPIMKTIDQHDQDLATTRRRTMEKISKMASYLTSESVKDFQTRMQILTLFGSLF